MNIAATNIILSQNDIQNCLERLANQLRQAYTQEDNVVAIVLLEGARRFAADLIKEWDRKIPLYFLRAKSYGNDVQSSGLVEITTSDRLLPDLTGKRVLLIDDIYDTGLTLRAVLDYLAPLQPADIKTCILLEKHHPHARKIPIDFLGATVPNTFVVGYGLDYAGKYRELDDIVELEGM
ncbi:MAG: hypoxanthine phosphoribosyltransferase [Sedimentisphaerales bacterium]|nr:hypoxanthine phosphoribosyltransferase [Sedimentisphaerales bacterium]